MDLWHMLVLSVVRHTLDTNWDRLEHLSNYDLLIRKILGVSMETFCSGLEKEFSYQTIVDKEKDAAQVKPLTERLLRTPKESPSGRRGHPQTKFSGQRIYSHSLRSEEHTSELQSH